MKRILSCLLVCAAVITNAQSVTRLLVVSNFDNTLRILDTASMAQLGTKTMTFSGGSFQGLHGLARNPISGTFYGVVNDGAGSRFLASVNPVTGSVVSMGNLGDNFSQLTFNAFGTLLGITGSGASVSSKVYRINVANAAKSAVLTLNNVYGQVIAYNPSDNRVYHWTGGSSVTYNSYDTSFVATPVSISIGASSSEVTSAVYKTGNVFVTSDWDLNYRKVRAAGGSSVLVSYSSAGYYPKGMAYITCSRSITPANPVVCANNSLSPTTTLTMNGGVGATYQWYKNNVAISGATLAALNASATGLGYYKCRINDGCGQDSLAPGVNFSVAPLPTVAISGATSVCTGGTVQVSGSSGGTSQWYRNGVLLSGANTNSYNVTTAGVYNMIKTNLNGCADSASAGRVIVVTNITVTATTGNICPGGSFAIVPSGANTYSIAGNNFTVSPVVTTTYALSGTSTLGCIGNGVATVSVQSSLVISITGNTAVCNGLPVNLTASGAANYTWNTGATTNTVAPTPSVPTTYSVLGTSGTCSNTATFSVLTINPRPTVTALTSSAAICAGGTSTVTASGANTYTWTGGVINGVSFTPTITNSYSVVGTNTLTSCTSTNVAAITVTVNARPVISASSTNSVICNGFTTSVAGGGASTYTWTGGVTDATPFTPGATAQYSVVGTSSVSCLSSNTAVISITVNPLPAITVNSGTICSGYVFTMVPGGASSYTFSSGSNTISAITSTNYNVSGTSLLGCTSTVSATSTITVIPSPTLTVNSGSVCVGLTYSILPTGANTYSNNGSVTTSIAPVSPQVNTNYSITGTGTNGCVSPAFAIASVSAVVNPIVTAITSKTAICIGQATANLSASGANTYTWNTSSNSASIAVSPTATSVYTVSGTSTLLCTSTTTISVLVNILPNVGISVLNPFICLGGNSTLTASGASTYTWNTSSNALSLTANPIINTNYTVSGTDANGCVNNSTAAVTVNTIVLSTTPNGSVCLGDTYIITASGAVTYTWNGFHFFSAYPTTPTISSVYTVNAVDANSCPLTKTVSVFVFQLPTVSTTITRTLICIGESATISASGANTYSWNNGATSSSIVVSPTVGVLYNYTVVGTDVNLCVAKTTRSLQVSNCTGIISNIELSPLSIYPNPNNGEFVIKSNSNIDLVIVNEIGQVVSTLKLNSDNQQTVRLENLASGIYFVLGNSDGKAIKEKIIAVK